MSGWKLALTTCNYQTLLAMLPTVGLQRDKEATLFKSGSESDSLTNKHESVLEQETLL